MTLIPIPGITIPGRRIVFGAVATLTLTIGADAAVAGASTTPPDASEPSGDAPTVVKVQMTDEGCPAPDSEYPAGAITFTVENVSAVAVTEFEVLSGDRILGEKENLPPGFAGDFSLELGPGTYTLYCPGAATERTDIELTGEGPPDAPTDTAGLLQEGAAGYLGYVQTQVTEMVEAVAALDDAIATGDVEASKAAYANARPFYERIEPVAESFVIGDVNLDAAIDLRADDVEPTELTGFHRIEYGLWIDETTAGLQSVAAQLVADIDSLHQLVSDLTGFQPAELANGAVGLLDEAAAGKITGEEERYAHIDILDMAANVEGAEQAFAYLEPGLTVIDADLVAVIQERFDALDTLVAEFEDPDEPSGYVLYTELTDEQITALSAALQAVAEPLSQVAAKVVSA